LSLRKANTASQLRVLGWKDSDDADSKKELEMGDGKYQPKAPVGLGESKPLELLEFGIDDKKAFYANN
jgi:hypothetical protein